MQKRTLLCLLALALSTLLQARNKPTIEESEFVTQAEGAEEALECLYDAEDYYDQGEEYYELAAPLYLKAYQYNSNCKALNYKLGRTLLFGYNRHEALNYLLESDPNIMPDYQLLLGRAYQYNREWRRAADCYLNYLNSLDKQERRRQEPQIRQYIKECEFSNMALADSVAVFVNNAGNIINTPYDDYCPTPTHNDSIFIFTSRRAEKTPRHPEPRTNFKEQIYATQNPLATEPYSIWQFERLRSHRNMSVAGFSKSEERVFFYKGRSEQGRLRAALNKKDGEGWRRPRRLRRRVNRIATQEGAVSLDSLNNIYFISNRQGGEGGSDIWYAKWQRNLNWSKPVNIGSVVNTPFDEVSVHVSAGGDTLYFASNGHAGFGGYDIYMTTRDANGNWSEPVNMGYPINTAYDDICYVPNVKPDASLLASARSGGVGGLDIYSVVVDRRLPFTFAFKGIDAETNENILFSYVISDKTTGCPYSQSDVAADAQPVSVPFLDHGTYSITVSSAGYHEISQDIECPETKGATVEHTFKFEKLAHPFTLSGVVSDRRTGKALAANIEFRDLNGAILGKTRSSAISGQYSQQFPDRMDVRIEAQAVDYYDTTATIAADQIKADAVAQNLQMRQKQQFFVLVGQVTEEETGKPVYASLKLTAARTNKQETIITTDSVTGRYSADLLTEGPYWIDVEAKGYFFANNSVQFSRNNPYATRNFSLKAMKAGVKITLENILFNTGKSTLQKSSYEPLDKFADLLIKNPDVRIEVSGHTDNVGNAAMNKKLSKARAKTVRDYLIKKGVAEDRIDFEGYGMEQPVESNATKAGREKNRRVEVKVLD